MARVVVFALALLLLLATMASAEADRNHARERRLFKIRVDDQAGGGNGVIDDNQYYCDYTVRIKTSCESPRYTRDRVSIKFGDRHWNEVYVPWLDDPEAFESCSTDRFTMRGPCAGYGGVCYLYLRREGRDGWTPKSVQIYEDTYRRSATFYYGYGTPLPSAHWYGFDNCVHSSSSGSGSGSGAGAGADDDDLPVLLLPRHKQTIRSEAAAAADDDHKQIRSDAAAAAGTLPAVAGM